MMGSDVSQVGFSDALMQSVSEQRHVLSAMITPAAPERWALRTCERKHRIDRNKEKNQKDQRHFNDFRYNGHRNHLLNRI